MTFLKKLWLKSKFYGDLISLSFLSGLLALGIAIGLVAAILVFAPPSIAFALSIAACVIVAAVTVALNVWIWSKPMDMSKKFWNTQFSDPDMVQAILDSFKAKKNSKPKVKNALLKQKIA